MLSEDPLLSTLTSVVPLLVLMWTRLVVELHVVGASHSNLPNIDPELLQIVLVTLHQWALVLHPHAYICGSHDH